MSIRFQGSYTVTADTQQEADDYYQTALVHPAIVQNTLVQNAKVITFNYDITTQ